MNEKHIRILKAAIVDALGGPRGDPDRNNLYPAACIVKVLLDEGVPVEEDTLKGLKKDNMYDYDFLAEVEKEFEDVPKAPGQEKS
jgi:hypothetical protein